MQLGQLVLKRRSFLDSGNIRMGKSCLIYSLINVLEKDQGIKLEPIKKNNRSHLLSTGWKSIQGSIARNYPDVPAVARSRCRLALLMTEMQIVTIV